MDKGFKVYIFFLLWLGIVVGVPSLIFDARQVGIIGSIAASIGMAAMVLAEQGKENTFKKDVSVTYGHFWIFLAYAVGGMFMIGFGEMDYEEIKTLGKSIVFYAALPVPVLFIESYITEKKTKQFYATLSIGQLYEEQNSREGVPWYMHEKYFEFTRKSIWIIKELHHHHKIILQDVHFPRRVKSVTAEELKEFTKLDRVTWNRTPEYYEMIIDSMRKRASEEIIIEG